MKTLKTLDKPNPKLKPDLTRIPMQALSAIAYVIESGDRKYGQWDWLENNKLTDEEIHDHARAMMSHISEWLSGEDYDSESGTHKLAHAGARIMFLLQLDALGVVIGKDRSCIRSGENVKI